MKKCFFFTISSSELSQDFDFDTPKPSFCFFCHKLIAGYSPLRFSGRGQNSSLSNIKSVLMT